VSEGKPAVVRLLMLTGQRLAEIGALRWSEITENGIVLPASRTKNSRQHAIPLVPAARAILDARPRRPDRDFIFGRRRDRPLTGWSVCKAVLDGRLGSAVAPWVHHDLRRTMATRMAETGIAPHVIEAVLIT
jgi:integrase